MARNAADTEKRAGQVDIKRLRPVLRVISARTALTSACRPRRREPRDCPHPGRWRKGSRPRRTCLTSVGTGVASPPLSRIRPATTGRGASWSRAASTKWAPAAAMASAVAAPIPRLAPVTTANRPASQCLDSSHRPPPRHERQPIAGRAVRERPDSARDSGGVRHVSRQSECARVLVVLRTASAAALMSSGATRKPVRRSSTITSPSAPRSKATTGVPDACASAANHAEWLVPPGRANDDGRSSHRLPERRAGHSRMNADAWLGPVAGRSSSRAYSAYIAVAVTSMRTPAAWAMSIASACSLLRGSACRRRWPPSPPVDRPVDEVRRHAGREDSVQPRRSGARRLPGTWITPATVGGESPCTGVAKRGGDRLVRR